MPAARSRVDPGQPTSRARAKNARVEPQPTLDREATGDEVGGSGRGRGLGVSHKLLSADEYVEHRLLVELKHAQLKAPQLQRRLKFTQFLVILGAVACVLVNSIHASFVPESRISLLNPVVLALTGTVEAYMAYTQPETDLPAINGVVLALTRVLLWWDGLSLIQQRMPATRDRLVETCETAMLHTAAQWVRCRGAREPGEGPWSGRNRPRGVEGERCWGAEGEAAEQSIGRSSVFCVSRHTQITPSSFLLLPLSLARRVLSRSPPPVTPFAFFTLNIKVKIIIHARVASDYIFVSISTSSIGSAVSYFIFSTRFASRIGCVMAASRSRIMRAPDLHSRED